MDKKNQGTGIPSSALGRRVAEIKSAAPAPQAHSDTPLSAIAARIERGELVELPLLGSAYIRMLPHDVHNEVESRTLAAMNMAALPLGHGFGMTLDIERQVQMLAESVMDPDDNKKPFGSLGEWRKLDDDIIVSSFLVYRDVRERLDPIASTTLTPERMKEIVEALEKKSLGSLLRFGARELAIWLLTGELQRESSRSHASSSSPSSSDTSPAQTEEPDPE